MIDQMYLMLYNLVFTSLPPLVIGVYDKTITEDLLFTKPYLYRYVRIQQTHLSSHRSKVLIEFSVWFSESSRCRLSTTLVLDKYAGLSVPKFGHILCGWSGVRWIECWRLGVWYDNHDVLFDHNVGARCSWNQVMGKSPYVIHCKHAFNFNFGFFFPCARPYYMSCQ